METLEKKTLDQLQKGDIFSFGDKFWDEEHRFHSYGFYNDAKRQWHAEYKKGSRICVNYISFNCNGPIEDAFAWSFQWQHVQNPSEIEVFLKKKYMVSTSEKHAGKLFYNTNTRVYVNYKVNPINLAQR